MFLQAIKTDGSEQSSILNQSIEAFLTWFQSRQHSRDNDNNNRQKKHSQPVLSNVQTNWSLRVTGQTLSSTLAVISQPALQRLWTWNWELGTPTRSSCIVLNYSGLRCRSTRFNWWCKENSSSLLSYVPTWQPEVSVKGEAKASLGFKRKRKTNCLWTLQADFLLLRYYITVHATCTSFD